MVVVDISILRGTEFVHQFPGGVEVTLDIPAGYEEANTKVFRMEADGTATDMQAVCKDGKAVFVTNHFSTYVIAEQAKTAEEAPNRLFYCRRIVWKQKRMYFWKNDP